MWQQTISKDELIDDGKMDGSIKGAPGRIQDEKEFKRLFTCIFLFNRKEKEALKLFTQSKKLITNSKGTLT